MKEIELLEKLKKEISDLEKIINNTKNYKLKRKAIRDLKLSLELLKEICPYIITASIIGGVFTICGETPFYKQNTKYNLNTRYEFNNDGKYSIQEQYDEYKNAVNRICTYTKWEYKDNKYTRIIREYSGTDFNNIFEEFSKLIEKETLTENDIINFFNNKVNLILDNPTYTRIEITNSIPNENNNYIKLEYYDENKDEFIIREEKDYDNMVSSLTYILATTLGCLILGALKENKSNTKKEKIIEEYLNSIDIDELKIKLKIKKDNYERLVD